MDGIAARKIQVCGGDCRVSDAERDILSTVLGSCIAACIYDPVANLGGMNHYVLPYNNGSMHNTRYGDDALPRLIKQLQFRGADRRRLVAKIFGGARILAGDADIGQMNIDFAERFLQESDIPIVDSDIGGQSARWVDFHPVSGRSFVRTPHSRNRITPELLRAALVDPAQSRQQRLARAGK